MSESHALIVGDFAVNDVRSMCSKSIKILWLPKDMASETIERILSCTSNCENHHSAHIGSNDVKQQCEVLSLLMC